MNDQVTVMALGGHHVLLSGASKDGVYSIGFTRSPEPLLTPEAIEAYPINPTVILEFHDKASVKVFRDLVQDMYEHSTKPTWVVVHQERGST